MECIILAGGLGTRLRGVIGDQPKCMAPVNGFPFIHYLFQYLQTQGCTRVVLSLGYRHEAVLEWLAQQTLSFEVVWVIETEPLGTGGGIRLAMQAVLAPTVFILNGDTFFKVDLAGMQAFHNSQPAASVTIALKYLEDFERYGAVVTGEDHSIISFEEKKAMRQGWINGGIYLVDKAAFLSKPFPKRFSFEKEYLEADVAEHRFFGYEQTNYFIDIGVPDDYERAQQDFKALFP